MDKLVKQYVDKWHAEHPEPEVLDDLEFTDDDIPEKAKENMHLFSNRIREQVLSSKK